MKSRVGLRFRLADKVRVWAWIATFALAPFGNTTLGLLLLLTAEAMGFSRAAKKPNPPLVARSHASILVFLGLATVSAILSEKFGVAVASTAGYSLLLFGFYRGGQRLVAEQATDKLRQFESVLFFTSVAASLMLLVRYHLQGGDRATTLFQGPNATGTLFILATGLVMGFLLSEGNKLRVWGVPYLALMAAAILVTKSRGAWLGFAAMLGLVALRDRKTVASALVILLVVGAMFGASPALRGRLASAFRPDQNPERIQIWSSSIDMIKDNPVVGVGAGVFPFVYARYALPDALLKEVAYAHNLFLQVGAEFGILGLAAFLSFIFCVSLMGWRLYIRRDAPYVWAFAAFVGVMVHQMVDVPIWKMDVGGLFWALVGIIHGYYVRESQQVSAEETLESRTPQGILGSPLPDREL